MTGKRRMSALSDEEIGFILIAEMPRSMIAAKLNVHRTIVDKVRTRRTFRALRIAKRLGLLKPISRDSCWPDRPSSR